MGQRLVVNTTAVQQVVEVMDGALGGIEHILADLDVAGGRLSAEWNGLAAEAFAAAHRAWSADLAEMVRVARQLGSIAYESTERVERAQRVGAATWGA